MNFLSIISSLQTHGLAIEKMETGKNGDRKKLEILAQNQ